MSPFHKQTTFHYIVTNNKNESKHDVNLTSFFSVINEIKDSFSQINKTRPIYCYVATQKENRIDLLFFY